MHRTKRFLFRARHYLDYILHAKYGRGYGIHSPFLWEFWKNVVSTKAPYSAYEKIHTLSRAQQNNYTKVRILDLGAGGRDVSERSTTVADIAKGSGIRKKYGELLFRTVNYFQAGIIIEFGTSLGISSLYLSSAQSAAQVYTMEACPQRAQIAAETHKQAGATNIRIINERFENALPKLMQELPLFDLVFFDGNHQMQPTLDYFKVCKTKAGNESVFIFDDIYWSEGMKMAWEIIKADPDVRFSLDFHQIGMVFFRKELPKAHFVMRY